MHLRYEPITLTLETPFRIAHGSSTARHNVLVHLTDGDMEGWGEAAPVRQHHETQARGDGLPGSLPSLPGLPHWKDVSGCLAARLPGGAGRSGLALHDLLGRKSGPCPSTGSFGLNPARAP